MKRHPRTRLSPREIRQAAARMAREWATDRETEGDPEGAGVLRDLAAAIGRLRLTADDG